MAAAFEARIGDARNGGFQHTLRFGQRVIQPRALIQFVLVNLFLLHELLRCLTAFIAQQIDLKRQQSCASQWQRNFWFPGFHQSTMTGLPRRESLSAEYRAPFGLFLTNCTNRSATRTSSPVADTTGTISICASSHFTDKFLFVFTCLHSNYSATVVLTSFATRRTFFAKCLHPISDSALISSKCVQKIYNLVGMKFLTRVFLKILSPEEPPLLAAMKSSS
jgi:hypothetical protein